MLEDSHIFMDLIKKTSDESEKTNLTRKNAIVEYLDYQIPVTQLNGDMQAA